MCPAVSPQSSCATWPSQASSPKSFAAGERLVRPALAVVGALEGHLLFLAVDGALESHLLWRQYSENEPARAETLQLLRRRQASILCACRLRSH
jgi:hypothetical protein